MSITRDRADPLLSGRVCLVLRLRSAARMSGSYHPKAGTYLARALAGAYFEEERKECSDEQSEKH